MLEKLFHFLFVFLPPPTSLFASVALLLGRLEWQWGNCSLMNRAQWNSAKKWHGKKIWQIFCTSVWNVAISSVCTPKKKNIHQDIDFKQGVAICVSPLSENTKLRSLPCLPSKEKMHPISITFLISKTQSPNMLVSMYTHKLFSLCLPIQNAKASQMLWFLQVFPPWEDGNM